MPPNEHACPACGSPLVLRQGRRGPFWGCSAYPRCRIVRDMGADGDPVQPAETGVRCDECGAPMVVKRGPRGLFLGCSTYPRCRGTKRMDADAEPL
jgi:DNA topoisomerase-1